MAKDSKAFFVFLLVVSALFAGIGQILFKLGVAASVPLVLFIIGGVIFYGLSTLLYLFVLARAHLSWVYSFGGLSYIFTTLFAVFLLHEPAGIVEWAGVTIIVIGSVLIGMS